MPRKLIAQGAEAKVYLEKGAVLKQRGKKSYRIKEIDEKLRGFRTRREAKALLKLQSINFRSPRFIRCDDKENIVIGHVSGNLLKNILDKSNHKRFCNEIGKMIAILHNNSIIHGDLTTSNMILSNDIERFAAKANLSKFSIYFIDFGLSFFSQKAEDRAVDLHLLKEALESKHSRIWEGCFKCALDAYKKEAKNGIETLNRLKIVEGRGRYRAKNGS